MSRKFELSETEFATLLWALGFAEGRLRRDGGTTSDELVARIRRLTNTIQKDNSDWIPLDVERTGMEAETPPGRRLGWIHLVRLRNALLNKRLLTKEL